MARPTAANDLDERSLIEASQRDPRRFAELYDANFDRVYAYVIARVHDRAEAEDVTSEVFHHALANLARFEWRGVPFSAWLYRMATNAIADRAKRAGRECPLDEDEPAAGADFEEIELSAKVFRMVKDLPSEQSKVIEMRFASGASVREIAKHLGRSEGAVKQLQYRGLQTLRDRLGETDA